jgi:hypothetical protein
MTAVPSRDRRVMAAPNEIVVDDLVGRVFEFYGIEAPRRDTDPPGSKILVFSRDEGKTIDRICLKIGQHIRGRDLHPWRQEKHQPKSANEELVVASTRIPVVPTSGLVFFWNIDDNTESGRLMAVTISTLGRDGYVG